LSIPKQNASGPAIEISDFQRTKSTINKSHKTGQEKNINILVLVNNTQVHRPLRPTEFYLGVYSLAPSLRSNSIISLSLLFFAQCNGGQPLSCSTFTSAPFGPKSRSFSYVLCPVLNVKFITCHIPKRLQRLPVICHENKISRDSLRYNPQVIFLDSELKRRDRIN
jgi:hypothetical protein